MENLDTTVENVGNFVICLYALSTLVSIIFYNKYKESALRYFPIVLFLTFALEMSGYWLYEIFGYNALFYNIYNALFFLYFYYVFWSFIKNKSYKRWVIYGVVFFLIANLLNPIFNPHPYYITPQLLVYIVGGCLLIFCIILYFVEILSTSMVLWVKTDLLFWVSIGLLLFYVGYMPIKFTRTYFAAERDMFNTLKIVQWLLIGIMHSCFIIGFIWTKKRLRD